jgi:RimJ/RimL family protein N-acetyltransferase
MMMTVKPILLDIPMPIETPRLIIRPVAPGDGANINAAKAETWEQIHAWMPWAKTMSSVDDDEAVAREAYAKFILREDFMMVAIEKAIGSMAVFTGLHRFDWAIRRFEIGYWARKSAQGRGLVTESTNALTRYAFSVLGARTVAISHAEGNDASRAVIERLAFKSEGVLSNATALPGGTVCNRHWYGRTSADGLPELDVRWSPP